MLRLILLLVFPTLLFSHARASSPSGRSTVPGRVWVAEVFGDNEVIDGSKPSKPVQAQVLNASGLIIQTEAEAHAGYVFSNGTGMNVSSLTRIKITRFEQERFTIEQYDGGAEPSTSHNEVNVDYGMVGFCTPRLLAGSRFVCSTSLGTARVGARARIVFQASPEATLIYLLDGDCIVAANANTSGLAARLHHGEMARIEAGGANVNVTPIEPVVLGQMNEKVSDACRTRQTVLFDVTETTDEKSGGAEVRAFATRPLTPPQGFIVSPARMP